MRPLLVQRIVASAIVCGLTLVCVAGTNQSATVESSVKAPRIVFDNTEYVAVVTGAVSVAGTFTYQNKGNADLHVRILEMGGHTGSFRDYPPVPPGETGTIALTLSIGAAKGNITKHVKFGTDDPMNPVIPLTFNVNITTNVTAGPDKK
jgi:hypothetical protein